MTTVYFSLDCFALAERTHTHTPHKTHLACDERSSTSRDTQKKEKKTRDQTGISRFPSENDDIFLPEMDFSFSYCLARTNTRRDECTFLQAQKNEEETAFIAEL